MKAVEGWSEGAIEQVLWTAQADDGGDAYHRGLRLEGKAAAIGDGAAWIIDGVAEMYCPGGVWVVDRYHAVEHLWALGREAYGEEGSGWVERMKEHLWRGEVGAVGKDAPRFRRRGRVGVKGWRGRPITLGSERSR